jgi:hypothetical protein
MFPEYFGVKKEPKPKAPAVEGPTPPKKETKPKFTYKDLSKDQQKMADFFEERGIKKKQEYVDELAKIGALE